MLTSVLVAPVGVLKIVTTPLAPFTVFAIVVTH